MQEAQLRPLLGEPRSHMPRNRRNENIKQKEYCDKVSKDLKCGEGKTMKKKTPEWEERAHINNYR